jgi:hypothetical protein
MRTTFVSIATVLAFLVGVGAASPLFEPVAGRYEGTYASADHGPGKVRLKVGARLIRSRFSGVQLIDWSGRLHCPGHRTQRVDMQMTGWRIGRTFSGFVEQRIPPYEKQSFTGRFTAKDVIKATVRVTRGRATDQCDTGRVTFVARHVVR